MQAEPTIIRFIIPAVPVAQPRQRHRIIKTKDGRQFVHNYTPTKDPVNAFKATARMAASAAFKAQPLEGPLELQAIFVLSRPKNMCWKRKPTPRVPHTSTPDTDNLGKSLKDALTALLWKDDAQIAYSHMFKFIAAGDEQPHVEVAVREILCSATSSEKNNQGQACPCKSNDAAETKLLTPDHGDDYPLF